MIVLRDGKPVVVAIESAVGDRASSLVNEFESHWEKMQRRHGTERGEAFEGWATQKIAGLQLVVEHLTVVLAAVEGEWKVRERERQREHAAPLSRAASRI